MPKEFLVIGLGRFGRSLARELFESGHHVTAIDRNPNIVNQLQDYATVLAHGNTTNEDVLSELPLKQVDTAFVAIGEQFDDAIITVVELKQRGCKRVVAKASDRTKGIALEKVGADFVVYPEEETGRRLAQNIVRPEHVIAKISLDDASSFIERVIPKVFINKTILELNVRKKYKITIFMILRKNKRIVSPPPSFVFEEDDIIYVFGDNKNINRFQNLS